MSIRLLTTSTYGQVFLRDEECMGDAALRRCLEQLLRCFQAALVVVADLSDDIGVTVVADDAVADDELTIH